MDRSVNEAPGVATSFCLLRVLSKIFLTVSTNHAQVHLVFDSISLVDCIILFLAYYV